MIAPARILVTGGDGRLGKALARLGCAVASREGIDITDTAQIADAIARGKPAVLINAAAYTKVDAAESNRDIAHQVNALGAGRVARVAADAGIPLIHISTDMVFSGGAPDHPVDEDTAPVPASVYGATKLEGEHLVAGAGGAHTIARVSWLFDRSAESFISKILAIARTMDSLSLVADEFGRPTPVDALAGQLFALAGLFSAGTPPPQLLHLGPRTPVSRLDWARHIFEVSRRAGGPAPKLTPVPSSAFETPAPRPTGLVLDVSRAEALLGPMPDWQSESEAAVRALLENQ